MTPKKLNHYRLISDPEIYRFFKDAVTNCKAYSKQLQVVFYIKKCLLFHVFLCRQIKSNTSRAKLKSVFVPIFLLRSSAHDIDSFIRNKSRSRPVHQQLQSGHLCSKRKCLPCLFASEPTYTSLNFTERGTSASFPRAQLDRQKSTGVDLMRALCTYRTTL